MARVLVTSDMSPVNITLAKTFGSLCSISFSFTFWLSMLYMLHTVILLWSKSSKAVLVEYVESGLHVVDLSAYSLRLTTGVGGLPPIPSKLEDFAKSPL